MRNASALPSFAILLLFIALSIPTCTTHPSFKHGHHHSSSRFSTFQSSDESHSDEENCEEDGIFKYPRVSDLEALLKGNFFFGDWSDESESDFFHFGNVHGFSSLVCQSGSSCVPNLHIFDGPYKTRESLLFFYSADIVRRQMESYNKTNASLTYQDINVNLLRHSALHAVPITCNTITSVYFINISNQQPFLSANPQDDQQFFGVQFEVESPECGFHILTTIMTPSDPVFNSQIIKYILLMSVFAFIEGGACIHLFNQYKRRENLAKKVSKGTLALMNAFSFYLTFFTAFQFLNPVSYYAFVALIFAVLSFALWPRLIWKVTVIHIRRIDPRRKAKAVVQAYFWMLAIVVIPLLSISVDDSILYYVESFALVPQIIHNYQHSRKYQCNFELIACIVLPKALFVTYIQADSQNLFRSEPDLVIAGFYLGLLFMQCLILLIQTRWPRFGNEMKLPYEVLLAKEVNPKEDVCSICLENLKKSEAIRKSLLGEMQNRKMLITPCKHKYHEPCLKTWLKTKSECPNCRKPLPILDDDDDE